MNISFNVRHDTPKIVLDQLLHWGHIAETGEFQPEHAAGGSTETAQAALLSQTTFSAPPAAPLPGGMVEFVQGAGLGQASVPANTDAAAPAAPAAPAAEAPAPKRRGRMSNAEKERLAAEAAARTAQTAAAAGLIPGVAAAPAAPAPAPAPVVPPPMPPLPTGMAPLPAAPAPAPVAPPPVAPAPAASVVPVGYTPPAMPQVAPAPVGPVMAFEEMRGAVAQLNASAPGVWAEVSTAKAWPVTPEYPAGEPKPSWYTLENVPEAARLRLVQTAAHLAMARASAQQAAA